MRHNAPMATKILVVDNYDSFVFNLVQYLQQLGAECTVVRNDAIAAEEASKYDGVLISPGPGTPEKAGISVEMIKYCAQHSIHYLASVLVTKPLVLHLVQLFREHPNYCMERHHLCITNKKVCCQIYHHHLPQLVITRCALKKILSLIHCR